MSDTFDSNLKIEMNETLPEKITSWNEGPCIYIIRGTFEPPHDKTNKMSVRPAKAQISLASAQSNQSLRCELNG